MIKLLEIFNFRPPAIIPGIYGNVEIKVQTPHLFDIYYNQERWMRYDYITHSSVYELFSHYYLAKGHTVVTGLGFGLRENWILTKSEVTKLTIVEINKDIISFNKEINPGLFVDPRVEIINEDANQYKTDCDVLLVDHYEDMSCHQVLYDVNRHVARNIKSLCHWFWPLDVILLNNFLHQKNVIPNAYLHFLNFLRKHNLDFIYIPSMEELLMFYKLCLQPTLVKKCIAE